MSYNEIVESCFFAPKHIGILDLSRPYSAHYRSAGLGKGEVFDVYLLCDEKGFIEKARFKAYGNPYLIAATEWLCRQLEGSVIHEHPRFNSILLQQILAIPITRYSIALEIEKSYKALVVDLKLKLTGELNE